MVAQTWEIPGSGIDLAHGNGHPRGMAVLDLMRSRDYLDFRFRFNPGELAAHRATASP